MSVQTKKRFKNLGKIVSIGLFTLLMLTNIKLALLDDNEIASGDISLFGIEVNLFDATYACDLGGGGSGGSKTATRWVPTGTTTTTVLCQEFSYGMPSGATYTYSYKTVYWNNYICLKGGNYSDCNLGSNMQEYAGGGC